MKKIAFTIFLQLLFMKPFLSLASERNLSIVGLYSQSKINYELDTNSPFYTGKDTQPDASFSYGALLETPLQGQWGFETGLIFLQRGFQTKNSFDSSTNVYRWKSLYIPFTGRFHPTKRFMGSIGLYLDYAVSKVSTYNTSNSNDIQYEPMKNLGLRELEYGMTYSAGMEFAMNASTSFLIEVRFNESWSNLMDTSLPTVNKSEKATLSEAQLYLGFTI